MRFLLTLIFVSNFYSAHAQDFNYRWHRYHNEIFSGISESVQITDSNLVYELVNHSSPLDVDPAPWVVMTATSGYSIIKYGEQREFVWARTWDLINGRELQIQTNGVDGIYFYGQTGEETFDADPGPGVHQLTLFAASAFSSFIIKLDMNGIFQWAHILAAPYGVAMTDMDRDADGNLYMIGGHGETFDADPGPGVVMLPHSNWLSLFMVKWDSDGNYLNSFALESGSCGHGASVEVLGSNVFVSTLFYDSVDIDPSLVDTVIIFSNSDRVLIAKYDTALNYRSSFVYQLNVAPHLALNMVGDLIIAGSYNVSFDADPTAGTFMVITGNQYRLYFSKLDTAFNFQLAFFLEQVNASTQPYMRDLEVDDSCNIYTAGEFEGAFDFDPGPASYLIDPISRDAFFAWYDSAGGLVAAHSWGNNWDKQVYDIDIGDRNRFFISAAYQGATDVDPGPAEAFALSSNVYNKPLVVEYSTCLPMEQLVLDTICRGIGRTFGDSIYFETGTYVHRYRRPTACDSVVTLNLLVTAPNITVHATEDTLWCAELNADAYEWVDCEQGGIISTGDPFFVPQTNGPVAVIVSQFGCADTSACINLAATGNLGTPELAWGEVFGELEWGQTGPHSTTDQYGNLYVAGRYRGRVDMELFADSTIYQSRIFTWDDAIVAKYDTTGQLMWAYPMSSAVGQLGHCEATSIAVGPDGSVYVGGTFERQMNVYTSENEQLLVPTVDPGTSNKKAFFMKLLPSGKFSWANSLIGTGLTNVADLSVDNSGNVAICGEFYLSDFDPSPAFFMLNGGTYIAKYDTHGGLINAFSLPYDCDVEQVSFDPTGNLIASGAFEGLVDFDPGTTDSILNSANEKLLFLASYDQNLGFNWAKRFDRSFTTTRRPMALATDKDGDIYLYTALIGAQNVDFTGGNGNTPVPSGAHLLRYSSDGTFQRRYPVFGGSGNISMVLDPNGDILIAGKIASPYFLVTTNDTVYTPYTGSYVLKCNNAGTAGWGFGIEDQTYINATIGICAGLGNDFYLTAKGGTDPFDIDPGNGTYMISTNYGYLAKYGTICGPVDTSAVVNATNMSIEGPAYVEWKRCSDGQVMEAGMVYTFSPCVADSYYAVLYQGACVDSTACYLINSTAPSATLDLYPAAICIGQSVTFSTQATALCAITYQWYLNGSLVTGEINSTYTSSSLTPADQVYCVLIGNNGLDMITTPAMSISTLPEPNTTIMQAGDTLSVPATSTSYQWLDCNNGYAPISGETGSWITLYSAGDYAVEVSLGQCVDTSACANVTVGLLENTNWANTWSARPNPVKDELTIQVYPVGRYNFRLLDMQGVLIKEFIVQEWHVVQMNDLAPGIYLLRGDVNGQRTMRLVKM